MVLPTLFCSRGFALNHTAVARLLHHLPMPQVYSMFDRTMLTIKRLGKEEDLMKVGFTNFKLRHTGRFDMQIDDFSGMFFSFQ